MWAAGEALARHVPLKVVSCYTLPYAGDALGGMAIADLHQAVREASESALGTITSELRRTHPGLEVTWVNLEGSAAVALVSEAGPDDLLVVGTSRRQGAAAFWLGSTPRGVVRRSPCPVVVAHDVGGGQRPNRIVVGVDGSPEADDALRWACDEADLHGVELTVVHAWEYPYAAVDFDDSQARDLMRVDAARVLEQAVAVARECSGAAITDVLFEGSAANALLQTATDGDLVVVGSRGRGAVATGLFGSTATAVIERATTPVAVVRHQHG